MQTYPEFAPDFHEAAEERQTHRLTWRGTAIEIEYRPCWLCTTRSTHGYDVAHLEITSTDRARLPITETGYRSHFTDRTEIEAAGGPVAYVTAFLDEAAQSPEWLRYEAESRQGNLFGAL